MYNNLSLNTDLTEHLYICQNWWELFNLYSNKLFRFSNLMRFGKFSSCSRNSFPSLVHFKCWWSKSFSFLLRFIIIYLLELELFSRSSHHTCKRTRLHILCLMYLLTDELHLWSNDITLRRLMNSNKCRKQCALCLSYASTLDRALRVKVSGLFEMIYKLADKNILIKSM